ncbi:hypothetical protein SAMN06296273_0718 [Nitrosomonas ureae]|uniref:Uncharacterized protein n=1 Tax=Nitrosomonas ureae TaxID=44577 RepID=A0A285BVG1_9PROT|nr:hypothetical protein [Nitrosomonas ureae]SNX59277.1 hypothetical protein SAMN06296273_0718 [Nitrosomonas ureae]
MRSLGCITSHRVLSSGEMPINSGSEMEYEAHETQQPRHITKIGEGASAAQRSDSLEQPSPGYRNTLQSSPCATGRY